MSAAAELAVWYGPMPESNGRQNWTAILHRKGKSFHMDGFCFARSEYPDRVRYEADRMRWIIGELVSRPDILAYDDALHSGYVNPAPAPDIGALVEALTLLRAEHAEWSAQQFGNVSAVGPAKHLSKEALEVAADPHDAIEHADCWMLLWDMQRRAGISDAQLASAITTKLAINKARKWPEPEEGEAREHMKGGAA